MGLFQRTLYEVVILAGLSLALAFGVNAARSKGSIKVSKNYFDKGGASPAHQPAAPSAGAPAADKEVANPTRPLTPQAPPPPSAKPNPKPPPAAAAKTEASSPPKHLDHPYKEVDADQVLAILKDPNTAKGLNVIIDARNDDHYGEGHLPGAIQSFPFEFDRFRADVMNRVNGAEKIIVYCGGGDCEDSIFMCRELVAAGVPEESLYLFPGGYTEWTARKFPTDSATP